MNSKQAKRVGIWIRVSTEDQAIGESPEHHAFRAQQYAGFQGWTVVETYDLAGVSGKSVWQHPECQRMLRDVRRGHIQGLIFSKLARLARNTRELLDFAEVFEKQKAALVSIEEKIDTSTPAGLLFYTMIGAIGQWEREEIVARVRSSISVRAKLGKPLNGVAPYGFRWEGKKLVQIPEESAIRKLAFELFLEHRRKGTVASLLNKRGFRTRNKCRFADVHVGRMLRCTSAKGVYRTNMYRLVGTGWDREVKPESEWGSAPCQPIVSEEVFARVNQLLEEQYKPAERPAKKPVHVFAGIVRCECGGKMYVYTRSPNYTCNLCKNKVAATVLDELFLGSIADTLADGGQIAKHLRLAKEKIAQRERDAAAMSQQVESVKAEMRKVYELYMAGGVDVDRFKALNIPLEERLTQMKEELARMEGETLALQVNDLSAEAIAHESKGLAKLWPSLDIEGKQRMASLLCSSIIIPKNDPEGPIEITLKHCGAPAESTKENSPSLNCSNSPRQLRVDEGEIPPW